VYYLCIDLNVEKKVLFNSMNRQSICQRSATKKLSGDALKLIPNSIYIGNFQILETLLNFPIVAYALRIQHMGRKPGELLMGQLERRSEVMAGDFNSQEVSNTV
jgi:hypothetical protein